MAQRVFGRVHRGFQAPLGLRGLRVPLVFQDKGFRGYQEHPVLLVHRGTQELENLECPGSQGNLEVLDYLDPKVNLVQVVVKDSQGRPGPGDCQAHLGSQEFLKQGGRAYQASPGHSENPD